MTREEQIDIFLEQHAGGAAWLPFVADASFRRYFRVRTDPATVLMDAPPDKEDVVPFMAIGAFLHRNGFSAPKLQAADVENGFLLLEDLGDDTYSRLLAEDPDCDEQALYEAAVDVLVALHRIPVEAHIQARGGIDFRVPAYDARAMAQTALLLCDWYLPARNGAPLPISVRQDFETLWEAVLPDTLLDQPVLALRDYHADNLMWLPERQGIARVGLLDFQDAGLGSPAYDLVSLLQDCRREVSETLEQAMLERYLAARPELDRETFLTAYAIAGAQRNTRIVGVFTRLWKRDGKPGYPKMIPNVWGFVERNLGHPALADLKEWFDLHCPVSMRRLPLPGEHA